MCFHHGMQTIRDKIYQHLLDLDWISRDGWQFGIKIQHHFCTGHVQIECAQFRHARDDLVQADRPALDRTFARKRKKIADKFRGTVALVRHLLKISPCFVAELMPCENQLKVPFNDGQRVIDVRSRKLSGPGPTAFRPGEAVVRAGRVR